MMQNKAPVISLISWWTMQEELTISHQIITSQLYIILSQNLAK